MQRLTELAMERRRLVAIVWLVLALAGAWAASGIGDALSQSFDAPGREAFQANRQIAERFGNGGPIAPIVVVAQSGDGARVTDRATRAQLGRAVGRIGAAVGRARTVSYASTGDRAFVSADGRTRSAGSDAARSGRIAAMPRCGPKNL